LGDDSIHSLGVDATTGRPLDPIPGEVARRQVDRIWRRPRPVRYGVATGDLASAGWGVVFTEGVDASVRDALGPLLALRRRQAGDRYRELIYRTGDGTIEFRGRLRAGLGRVDPRQVPWYLLLVGSPAELPHGFEHDLDVPHAVGRLAFDDADDLAAYARRAAHAETRPAPRTPPRSAVFAPSHPDDAQTLACAEHLARPLAELLASRAASPTVRIGEEATRGRLLELIDERPDLLVAIGHTVVFPPDHRHHRERQGALLCADWPGPARWPRAIPAAQTVAAADLPPGALDGGVAVLFGCHTAGTPRFDRFDGTDPGDARELTPRPFVSALAQRLLGRRGGALAVFGHVGRAFVTSIVWRGALQTQTFEDALQAILDGRRLGEALDGFGQRFADVAVAWTRSQMEPAAHEVDLLDLWMAFHDARSWSLIGDPAVRLPAAEPPS